MTQPMPEDESEPLGLTEAPDDEHDSELPDATDADGDGTTQQTNAGSSQVQPSDDTAGH